MPDVKQTLLALDADDVFGVSCGDIMFDNLSLYPCYEEAVRKMKVPFLQVIGNHDLDQVWTDDGSAKTFSEYFGPTYYSFDRGEVHHIVLDDVFWYGGGYMRYLDAEQLYGWSATCKRSSRDEW